MSKNEVKESIKKHSGKRKYGENGKQKRSQKKQKISNEHGWNSRMRTKFYKMSGNMNDLILKNDMTDLAKRPEGVDSKKDAQVGKRADGFWSDNTLNLSKSNFEMFIKFIIYRDEKRRKEGFYIDNPNVKEIKDLKDINHHDVKDFIDYKLDSGCANTTVRKYVGDIQKVAEATAKFGISGHKNMVRDTHFDMIPNRNKDDFIRNKGATDGMRGYTAAQGEKLINTARDPYVKLGIMVLNDVGLRKDTFYKLQWRDVLDENNNVREEYFELFRPGLMKGGREQIAKTSDRVTEGLKELWKEGNFNREDEIFGGFTHYKFEKEMKNVCEEAEVDWKSYHAFRRSTVETFDKMAEKMTKEELVDEILKYVDLEIPHRRTGELYKPHNPIVEKKENKMKPKLDSQGNPIRRKDGSIVEIPVKKKGEHGEYIDRQIKTDETGHPVKGPKWTKEELMNSRIDFLRNVFVAEQISHNRPDANSPYRFEK